MSVEASRSDRPCLGCGSGFGPFMSLGRMPIANGFLAREEFAGEYFFDLAVGFCKECQLVQLVEQVDRARLFHDRYAFYSSTSVRMAEHFRALAERMMAIHARVSDPFLVEIGSNDGILLRHVARAGLRHLGIEPSANVAEAARGQGVRTLCAFFDEDLARRIATTDGMADLILGANVMCHIPYLHSVVAGIKALLKPTGVLVFEDPYLGDILERTSYDQIYDEHAVYFSLHSVARLFGTHGLEVVDVDHQDVHGGSLRYTLAHTGARPASGAVAALARRERELGLDLPSTYDRLRANVERSRAELRTLLSDLRRQGRRVVGYGATSKSTTITNYCGLTSELVEFICDTTPIKQGKYSPGTHIPIRPYEAFQERYPDFAVLFAWNHADEIMAKEQAFLRSGGRFVAYVPSVRVLD